MKKVLITGIDSFTGRHLEKLLSLNAYDVYGTSLIIEKENIYTCDITKKDEIKKVLSHIKPDFLIHLAGISYAAHENFEDFYLVNTIGTVNILNTILELELSLKKIILASSATVYGNQGLEILDESLCPKPANHYGASKYSMECMARNYFNKLPILITRPFNYTGVGQAEHFLVPKIVEHFKERKEFIELGNLDIVREFNDVTFVCEVYKKLLESEFNSKVLNICSNRGIKLLDIIKSMEKLTNHNIKIKINEKFIRKDDIKSLTGSSRKLFSFIGEVKQVDFEDTLKGMLINES